MAKSEGPSSAGPVLERPRLLAKLDTYLRRRLTLVVAPAGYGKTELLRGWTDRRRERAFVWLSMDERDADLGRFWQTLVSGIGAFIPGVADGPMSLARSMSVATVGSLVEATCVAMANDGTDVTVILDDFHFVSERATLDSIDLFRDAMPGSSQLILAGRYEPDLPLARMRVTGQLGEIRETDLRFTRDETRELIASAGVSLDETDIGRLHERTEGWGAALRLAILSMERASDPSLVVHELSGTDRTVADYLLEEVVDQMDPTMRGFIFSSAIVDELNGELGAALSGRADAATRLAEMAAAGVFTVPVGHRQGWYRFHRLLRDLMRAHLRHDDPSRYADLHRRAARWLHEHGELADSVRHALAAGDVETASGWLGEAAPELVGSGHAETVEELSRSIIESADEPDALMLLTRYWALYVVGAHPRELDDLAARLEDMLEALPATTPEERLHGDRPSDLIDRSTLPWLRGLVARARGALDALLALDDPDTIPSPSGRVEGWLAEGLIWIQRTGEARPLINTWLQGAEQDGYLPSVVHGLGLLAMAKVEDGELGEARADAARGLRMALERGFSEVAETIYARLATMRLAWLEGDLTSAETAAVQVQSYAERMSDVPVLVQHALLRSRIRWSLGDRVGARALLDGAHVTEIGRPVEGHFASRLIEGRVMLDLLDGDFAEAERRMPDWRDRLDRGPETMRERLLLWRMLVASGEDATSLDDQSAAVSASGPLDLQEFERLRALALVRQGALDEAVDALARSMRTAARIDAIQPLLDDRARLAPVLGRAAAQARVSIGGQAAVSDEEAPVYVEPLSQREQTVLEMLPSHLTYPEIAEELFVSTNTVKTHAKAIYRKLAADSRSDAVARARAFGLIAE